MTTALRCTARCEGPNTCGLCGRWWRASASASSTTAPAPSLLRHQDGSIVGAYGIGRQTDKAWDIRAAGVVLATGGCTFFSNLFGSRTNTGDGYLTAAEAGPREIRVLSGREFLITKEYYLTFQDRSFNLIPRRV